MPSRGITQGDRTILTRLLILSHSAFSAASTKTPHERRRAQVRAPEPVWVSMPPRWSSLPDSPARGMSPCVGLQPCLIGHRAPVLDPGNSMIRLVRSPWGITLVQHKDKVRSSYAITGWDLGFKRLV